MIEAEVGAVADCDCDAAFRVGGSSSKSRRSRFLSESTSRPASPSQSAPATTSASNDATLSSFAISQARAACGVT